MKFRYGFHSVLMSGGHPRRQRTESVYVQGTAHTNASVAIAALGITDSGALQRPIGGDPEADRMGVLVRVDGPDNYLRQEHGYHILCGALGLRRAVEIDQPSLLRVLLELVNRKSSRV